MLQPKRTKYRKVQKGKMKGKQQILVAIDIGNSALAYGVFRGKRLVASGHHPSNNIPQFMSKLTQKWVNTFKLEVIITSVVPFLYQKLDLETFYE